MIAFRALIWRDLLLSFRSGGGALLGVGFFVLVLMLAPLGLGGEPAMLKAAAPGLIWIAALLSSLIGLERVIQPDVEDGTIDLLRLSALPLEWISLAKALAHWITSGLLIALLSPVIATLMMMDERALLALFLTLLLGTPALSLVGVVGAALGAGVRRGGVLLAIIVLPLNVPTLIFGAGAISAAQMGLTFTQPLLFVAAISIFSAVIGPFACAAALRLNDE